MRLRALGFSLQLYISLFLCDLLRMHVTFLCLSACAQYHCVFRVSMPPLYPRSVCLLRTSHGVYKMAFHKVFSVGHIVRDAHTRDGPCP